ncbi:MAG: hypothetical protein ABID40_03530 [Candidatus Bipolaricaulota bacterium]
MTRLAWILSCVVAAASVGWAQVRIWGELGWQGQAVAGQVNPLTITVENGTGSVLSATLRAEQRVGSGWRGQAEQRLRAPILLAPGGRARFVFPWPVEAGSDPVTLIVEVGGTELVRATLPVRLAVGKLVAVVGTLAAFPSPDQAVFLAPDDLPEDPLLLGPFSRVQVAPTALVSAKARDALAAWAAFGGGSVEGVPVPTAIPPLRDDDLRDALRLHRPRRPPAGLLVGGTVLYLVAVGYGLPSLSRNRKPWLVGSLVLLSAAFSWFYPHLYGVPHDTTVVQYGITAPDVVRFSSDTLAIAEHKGGRWEGSGLWVERFPVGGERAGRDVEWSWGSDGPRTTVYIQPGKTVFLWRFSPAWVGGGTASAVGPHGEVPRGDAGFAPLLAAVRPLLQEGDRLFLDQEEERLGPLAWYRYRLRWERRG